MNDVRRDIQPEPAVSLRRARRKPAEKVPPNEIQAEPPADLKEASATEAKPAKQPEAKPAKQPEAAKPKYHVRHEQRNRQGALTAIMREYDTDSPTEASETELGRGFIERVTVTANTD